MENKLSTGDGGGSHHPAKKAPPTDTDSEETEYYLSENELLSGFLCPNAVSGASRGRCP